MSRFRYVILPRLLLALSTLALLAALFLLWLALERPLPSISLACRQAGPSNCFTGGEMLASGPIRFHHIEPSADAWAVFRSGDQYAEIALKRTAGVLWTVSYFHVYTASPSESRTLIPCFTALSHNLYTLDRTSPSYSEAEILWEMLPLAICTDPSVAELRGEILWLGDWENPQDALAQRGVSISLSPAGNGVWVGESVLIPNAPDPDNSISTKTTALWLRGYDAAGNLVCSYDPTA